MSQGLLAFTGVGNARIALLPLTPASAFVAVAAGVAAYLALRRGASAAPLALLSLLVLPWLPGPLPAILLLWTGPMVWLLWGAVALCMAPAIPVPGVRQVRPHVTAGVLAFAVGAASFWQVAPSVPGGDEPHYLIITQSLLHDGDLRIENNHRQREYRAYVGGDLNPDFRVRGRNREIYSIHAPGVSALVAPAFAIAGYRGVVLFLLLVSALGGVLAWHLAWLLTRSEAAAWFGWAAVTLSTTWIFHSFTVYPDGPGAVLTLTGVWALLRAEQERESSDGSIQPWLWHGAAMAALPWMHTRFAAIAGLMGALVLLRLPRVRNAAGKAAAFLCVPALSGFAWFAYFIKIYGTPNPSAPYGNEPNSIAFIPNGLAGVLFDQRFGLFAYAPVLLFAVVGLFLMLRQPRLRRYALEFLFVAVPYLLVVTYVAMWWGGRSAPARFVTPVLPWLAIPAAVAWTQMRGRAPRALALAALAFTVFASVALVLVDDGRLAFNARPVTGVYAGWLEWLNGNLDLGRGLPVWWRDDSGPLLRAVAVWSGFAAAGYFLVSFLARQPRLRGRGAFAAATAFVAAILAMFSLSTVWAVEGVNGRAPTTGQLAALRRLSTQRRLLAFELNPSRRLTRDAVPSRLRIEPPFSTAEGGAGRNDRPLFMVPAVPAGEYRLTLPLKGTTGWVMVGIGRDQFALRTVPLDMAAGPMTIVFPLAVRALIVRADEDGRRNVRGLTIEPLRILGPRERLTKEIGRRAVRYAGATVYFTDDRSFPEPEGFWVGGGRDSIVVLQPDQSRPTATLLLRNGAAENQVVVEAGGWRDGARLGPGEERRIDVPLDQARGATRLKITSSAGFRPSDTDANSHDDRFLGVWVKVLN